MDCLHPTLRGAVGVETSVQAVRPRLLSRLFVFIDGAAFNPARGDSGRAFYKRKPLSSISSSRRTMSATLARAQVWGSGRGMGCSGGVGG
jgi:hypothetical protein